MITAKSALRWTLIWFVVAMAFNGAVYGIYETHFLGFGSSQPHNVGGVEAATNFFTGYLVEQSLSIDNLFVIALVMLLLLHLSTGSLRVAALVMVNLPLATIGGVVDRLEQKGLLRREVSAEDRRARRLSLTPAGQRLLSRLRPVVEALQAEILAPLTRAEQAAFLALAQKALGLPAP